LFLSRGQLPDGLRAELIDAGLLALEEGLRGSVTYRNFNNFRSSTGIAKSAKLSKSWPRGAIAVTGDRLVVWSGRLKLIDTPHPHPVRQKIRIHAEPGKVITFRFELAATTTTLSGSALVRFHTSKAAELADLLDHLAGPA